MYSLIQGWKNEIRLFRPNEDGSTVSMARAEIVNVIDRLLTRKERNNGIATYLTYNLRYGYLRHVGKDGRTGFKIVRSFTYPDRYEVIVFGNVEYMLARANGAGQPSQPRRTSTEERRAQTGISKGPRTKKAKPQRALPSTGLHWHFRNHDLSFDDAVRIIARASNRAVGPTRERIMKSLDDRGVGSFRLPGGFVFRVDVACIRAQCFDLLAPIELRTTDDNTQGAWRRLRHLLKVHFECLPRTRQKSQILFLAAKREEYLARRYG